MVVPNGHLKPVSIITKDVNSGYGSPGSPGAAQASGVTVTISRVKAPLPGTWHHPGRVGRGRALYGKGPAVSLPDRPVATGRAPRPRCAVEGLLQERGPFLPPTAGQGLFPGFPGVQGQRLWGLHRQPGAHKRLLLEKGRLKTFCVASMRSSHGKEGQRHGTMPQVTICHLHEPEKPSHQRKNKGSRSQAGLARGP